MKIYLVIGNDFKTINLDDNDNWENFISKVAGTVPSYKNYSPDVIGDKFLWTESVKDKQAAIMVSIRKNIRIHLTIRLDGGSVISDATYTIIQKQFNTNGTCSTCFVHQPICALVCGCVFCFGCLKMQVKIWESEGSDNCKTHKTISLSKNLENFVQGNEEAMVNVWRVMSYVHKAKSAAYKAHLCRPEDLLVNTTGYSRQICPHCQKPFCFFCGDDWSSGKQNKIFSCGNSCYNPTNIQDNIIISTQDWPAKPGNQIPSFRYCPKCGDKGAMGEKCKMNQCKQCHTWYCFYCLTIAPNGAANCASKKSSYVPCPSMVEQSAKKIWELVS